jgi:hypothetical protein
MAERLVAVGLDADTIERQFVHVNLSVLTRAGFKAFREWVADHRFTLIVWDPMAQHFAGAGVDDDKRNAEVAQWIAELVNPVSEYGGTTICVDHLAKNRAHGNGWPRGAGAKKARARIVYEFKKRRGFDRKTVGLVTVKVVKNNDDAPIPPAREIRLGGAPFAFRESATDPVSTKQEEQAQFATDVRNVIRALEEQARKNPANPRLSESRLADLAHGNTARIRKVLKRLVNEPSVQRDLSYGPPVEVKVEGRKTKGGRLIETTYFWLRKEDT